MRKVMFIISFLAVSVYTLAQGREIRMPNAPSSAVGNITERNTGYWCSIEGNGGYTLMEGRNNVGLVNVEFTNGYRFNQYIKVGIGLGCTWYPSNNGVRNTSLHLSMPIYFNARGNMLSEDIRSAVPFWSVNIGTSLADGFFLTPTVGYRFGNKRSAFLVGVSYTLRHLKVRPGELSNYSGAMIKIGYEY